MSFEHPWWLIALLAVPALWVGVVIWSRSGRKAAARYADPALLRIGPSRRVSVIRLAALLSAITAIAAGPIAFARPTSESDRRQERGSVVLAIDVSKSMTNTDIAPSRLQAAVSAANRFLDVAPKDAAIGLVVFADGAKVLIPPVTDRVAARRMLTNLEVREGTAIGDAIVAGLGSLQASGVLNPIPATAADSAGRIVLLTDGDWSAGLDPKVAAERARALRVPVYTVLLGNDPARAGRTETPAEQLAAISTQTGGIFTQSTTTDDLAAVFRDLGSSLARIREVRDLSVWAVLGALVLLWIAGMLATLAWLLSAQRSGSGNFLRMS